MGYWRLIASPLSDKEAQRLARRARRGDTEAASRLLASVMPLVLKLLGRYAPGDEDVGQEVMLRLWRYLPRFDRTRPRLTTFTSRIVVTTIRTYYRQQQARSARYRALSAQVPTDESHGVDRLIRLESIEDALSRLGQLPQEQRALVVSRLWGGCTFRALAGEHTYQAVQNRFRRAMRCLREMETPLA